MKKALKILTVVLAVATLLALTVSAGEVANYSAHDGTPSIWLKGFDDGVGGAREASITVLTTAPVKSIVFPQVWGGGDGDDTTPFGVPGGDWSVTVNAIQNDAVVAKVDYSDFGDISGDLVLDFDKEVPAGKTTFQIVMTQGYFVTPYATLVSNVEASANIPFSLVSDGDIAFGDIGVVVTYIPTFAAHDGNPSSWIWGPDRDDSHESSITVNATAPVKSIEFANTWGGGEGGTPGGDWDITIEVIQNGAVVTTAGLSATGDMGPATVEFDKAIPAGLTTYKVTCNLGYFVTPGATFGDNVTCEGPALAIILHSDGEIGLAALDAPVDPAPADDPTPVTPDEPTPVAPATQTADLAVVAILALGAFAVAKKH